ncbi:MAG: pseudouridine synthase [Desulfocapsaceae bacterium]|nr:pseudouridine synthase [Desulfocapsaceae bacterium]
MRLQRFLSNVGFCSKRQGEKFIRAGKILVDGRTAMVGDEVSGNEDIVVDGQRLRVKQPPGKKILLFNKPAGVECSLSLSRTSKTLLDFDFGPNRVFPIGRLDRESHGLLLLTNDGVLGNRLARPSLEYEEEYLVVVRGEITPELLLRLGQGRATGEKKPVFCRVDRLEGDTLRFILHDGRTRLLRKLCEAAGLQIDDLLRVRVGGMYLQDMRDGEWRTLPDGEFMRLEQEMKANFCTGPCRGSDMC